MAPVTRARALIPPITLMNDPPGDPPVTDTPVNSSTAVTHTSGVLRTALRILKANTDTAMDPLPTAPNLDPPATPPNSRSTSVTLDNQDSTIVCAALSPVDSDFDELDSEDDPFLHHRVPSPRRSTSCAKSVSAPRLVASALPTRLRTGPANESLELPVPTNSLPYAAYTMPPVPVQRIPFVAMIRRDWLTFLLIDGSEAHIYHIGQVALFVATDYQLRHGVIVQDSSVDGYRHFAALFNHQIRRYLLENEPLVQFATIDSHGRLNLSGVAPTLAYFQIHFDMAYPPIPVQRRPLASSTGISGRRGPSNPHQPPIYRSKGRMRSPTPYPSPVDIRSSASTSRFRLPGSSIRSSSMARG